MKMGQSEEWLSRCGSFDKYQSVKPIKLGTRIYQLSMGSILNRLPLSILIKIFSYTNYGCMDQNRKLLMQPFLHTSLYSSVSTEEYSKVLQSSLCYVALETNA